MKKEFFFIIILSVMMFGLIDNSEAQTRKQSQKNTSKNQKISNYRNNLYGYGRFEPYYFAGGNINAGNYFGDLAPVNKVASSDISFTRPGFGLCGGFKFHHSMAFTVELNWVRVFGDDFTAKDNSEDDFPRYLRNLSFRNDIKELRVGLQIFLLPNYGGPNQRLPINAYLSLGFSIFHHEPKGKVPDGDYQKSLDGSGLAPQAGQWVKLRPLGTEGQNLGIVDPYKSIGFSIPIAAGIQFRIPKSQLNIGFEIGLRKLFTDYIDDVSTNYVDLDALEASDGGTLARIMSDKSTVPLSSKGKTRNLDGVRFINNSQGHNYFISSRIGSGLEGTTRGNPGDNDTIFITQIKLSYIVGVKIRRQSKYR